MAKATKKETLETDEAIKTNELTDEAKKLAAQKALKLKNQKEMKAAKAKVREYLATDEAKKALDDEIIAAMTRICGKQRVGGGGGGTSIVATLKTMFKKIGDGVGELEIFKATKMGRGEIRKKVREGLKKAAPAERFWLEFDERSENWVWIGSGAAQPKGWLGKAI